MSYQSGASVDANIAASQNDVVVDTKLDKEGGVPNAGAKQPIFVIVMVGLPVFSAIRGTVRRP
jgi:hypothetical protein